MYGEDVEHNREIDVQNYVIHCTQVNFVQIFFLLRLKLRIEATEVNLERKNFYSESSIYYITITFTPHFHYNIEP